MRNKDLILISVIAVVSVIVSYILGNAIFGDPNERVEGIKYIDGITSNMGDIDLEYFNPTMLNPTIEVLIGQCDADQVWDDSRQKCVDPPEVEDEENPDENPDEPTDNPEAP